MRRIVPLLSCSLPALALATLALACSGSHGRDDLADAGPRGDAASPVDAGPGTDGGGCLTRDVTAQLLCTGERHSPVRIWDGDDCFCGEELVCDTSIDRESPGFIDYARITTTATTCGPVCGACMPLDGSCEVPSDLYDGSFAVDVGGWVLPSATNNLTPNTCWTAPPPVGSGTTCPDAASGSYEVAGAGLCVPDDARTGAPIVVSVDAAVGCDTHSAGCRAVRTADGFEITPLARDCSCPSCGACPPEPVPQRFGCLLPPLEPGTYTIRYGTEESTVTVSATGTGNDLCGDRGI